MQAEANEWRLYTEHTTYEWINDQVHKIDARLLARSLLSKGKSSFFVLCVMLCWIDCSFLAHTKINNISFAQFLSPVRTEFDSVVLAE